MKQKISYMILLLAILAMQMTPLAIKAKSTYNGYEFDYDNHHDGDLDLNGNPIEHFGNGNRTKRVYKSITLKPADTTMTETAVGNFNIRIYPNPTKGQLTLNIANLGSNDKVQMFLIDFSGNELARMDFSTAEITIDLSSHVSGSYYLRLNSQAGAATAGFLKIE